MSRIAIIGGVLIACVVLGFKGGVSYQKGQQAKIDLKRQIAQVSAGTALAAKETQRLAAQAKAAEEARNLEDRANADPIDDRYGIDVERVRRLNLR